MKYKSVNARLLGVHDNLTAEFWVNHDIENCKKCQAALK